MSIYLDGPRPGFAGKAASLAANEKPPKAAAKATQPRTVNTAKLELATKHGTSQRFYKPPPGRSGSKPDGYEAVGRKPGRGGIGSPVTSRPYWLATSGATGDTASQLNAKQLEDVKRTGVHPTVAMEILNSAVHPLTDLSKQATGEKPFKLGGAASDVANIASNFVPVGKAAGIIGGLRGLKAIKDARVGVDAVEAAKVAEGADPQAALRSTLKGAKAARDKTNAGYTPQRAERVGRAEKFLGDSNRSPDERVALAKGEHSGAFEKPVYNGMQVLDGEPLKALQAQILDNPNLRHYDKISAYDGLTRAVREGIAPTDYELKLLKHVFGPEALSFPKPGGSLGNIALNIANIPRTLQSGLDISHMGRQGMVAATTHPLVWAKSFGPTFKAIKSDANYAKGTLGIEHDPDYPLALAAKIRFTDISGPVANHEEAYASDYVVRALDLVPKVPNPAKVVWKGAPDKVPLVPNIFKASARAYTGGLNDMKMNLFKYQLAFSRKHGLDIHNDDYLEALGRIINASTGQGSLPGGAKHLLPAMNTFLYSPRLMLSRLNYLDPTWMWRVSHGLPPAEARHIRVEALKGTLATVGWVAGSMYMLSRIPGVKAGWDPRSTYFGKVSVGNRHFDVTGGFGPYIRILAETITNTKISASGKKTTLGSAYGVPNAWDEIGNFMLNKTSPPVHTAVDLVRQKDSIGNPMPRFKGSTYKKIAGNDLVPLIAQDIASLRKESHGGMNGVEWAVGGYAIAALGGGVQVYGPKTPKGGSSSPLDAGSSGGSQYLPDASSGGGSLYLP